MTPAALFIGFVLGALLGHAVNRRGRETYWLDRCKAAWADAAKAREEADALAAEVEAGRGGVD